MAGRASRNAGARPFGTRLQAITPDELRAVRGDLGLSQVELAAELGVAANTVARWERGSLAIGNPELVRLAVDRLASPTSGSEHDVSPAGKRADATRHNLPDEPTSFVGRTRELEIVQRLIGEARLVTLTGPGGVGKSRLALRAAGATLDDAPDGVWLVELAPLAEPSLVARTIARALRVSERRRALIQTLIAHLRARQLVLVLDNCEHLAVECATVADAILRGCPDVRILATSREPLGLAGEVVWAVPSLDVPGQTAPADSADMMRAAAVQLFVDRARSAVPGFAPTDVVVAAIADICRQLDGLPLAIELAAGRLRGLSVNDVRSRLHDRLLLLESGSRTALARHQTLRAALEWSYDLLSDAERELFDRLSVFAGGWTLDAAERVCGEVGKHTPGLLVRLVEKSMLATDVSSDGLSLRYRWLETLRQFAHERLARRDEVDRTRERHALYYLEQAEQAQWTTIGPSIAAVLEQLEVEHDNFRAALGLFLERRDAEHGVRLIAALQRPWGLAGYAREGEAWLQSFLDLSVDLSPRARALGLAARCVFLIEGGEFEAAWTSGTEATPLLRATGDSMQLAHHLVMLSIFARRHGEYATAIAMLDEATALFDAAGADLWKALSMAWLAHIAVDEGRFEDAANLHVAARAIWPEISPRVGSWPRYLQGQLEAARVQTERSVELYAARSDGHGVVDTLIDLGHIKTDLGDLDAARTHIGEALTLAQQRGSRFLFVRGLEAAMCLAEAGREPELALRLAGAADRIREAQMYPMRPSERPLLDSRRASARAALNDEAQAAAVFAAGRGLSRAEVIKELLDGLTRIHTGPDQVRPRGRGERPNGLTDREIEVLRLLARGQTNRAIAAALVLSPRTVSHHLENIFAKLDVTSRTAAASVAFRSGLA